jgi:hypothetical protein
MNSFFEIFFEKIYLSEFMKRNRMFIKKLSNNSQIIFNCMLPYLYVT